MACLGHAQGIEAEIPQARRGRAEELERIARFPPQAGMRPNEQNSARNLIILEKEGFLFALFQIGIIILSRSLNW
jgi:hypothetical protein